MIRRYVYYIGIAIAAFLMGILLVQAKAIFRSRPMTSKELNDGTREANYAPVSTIQSSDSCSCGLNEHPHAISVSPRVIEGRLIKRVEPQYPPLARTAHIKGDVIVEVRIDHDGRVSCACAIGGPALLRGACVHAAQQTLFKPALRSCIPVEVIGTLTYKFRN